MGKYNEDIAKIGLVGAIAQQTAREFNMTEREREREAIFQEEYRKIDKGGAIAMIVIGCFTWIILIGIPLVIIGSKRLSQARKLALEKAIKRVPYVHDKRK